jgi:hypothetical protein
MMSPLPSGRHNRRGEAFVMNAGPITPVRESKVWIGAAVAVACVVRVLTALALLAAVHHLFDVLGNGGLPSQDKSFQWAAVSGGLASALAVGSVLIAVGMKRRMPPRTT